MDTPLKLWREDPTPEAHKDCPLCPLAQQRSRMIWGEGNPEAKIFVLLDNPGAREDKLGEPFVCGSRQALYAATAKAGLGENDLYVTYVLRCRPKRNMTRSWRGQPAWGSCRNRLRLSTLSCWFA